MGGASGQSGAIITHILPETLALRPEQVARYAGGRGYVMDRSARIAITAAIEEAKGLMAPVFMQAFHPVMSFDENGCILLENGISVQAPAQPGDPSAGLIAATVCTIGSALEIASRHSSEEGDPLRALYLDAAGVAALEMLSETAHDAVSDFADSRGMTAGCRFAPGYMGVAMSFQGVLFRLVEAERIGVRLNDSMVMHPAKSLSFFTLLSEGRGEKRKVNKCRLCGAKECQFRLVQ